MSDTTTVWLNAVRSSHDRLTELLTPLDEAQLQGPSYDSEWDIAAVASHLGSQAEIFGLVLDAGLTGGEAPGGEVFGAIWDRWNTLPATEMASQSIATNAALVERLEGLPLADRDSFTLAMFGRELDFAGFAGMRLGEHALHTWDVAVALDPTATVSPDAVELLIDSVGETAKRASKAVDGAAPVTVETTEPARRFRVTLAPEVDLTAADESDGDAVVLPAEAFLRLVAGRLDPEHTPAGVGADERLTQLRAAFPGF